MSVDGSRRIPISLIDHVSVVPNEHKRPTTVVTANIFRMPKKNNRVAAFELVDRAIRLQLSGGGELAEVEDCLQQSLKLDLDNIEVLQEAAHFYDTVVPKRQKARRFAMKCRGKALKLVAEMDTIINQRS